MLLRNFVFVQLHALVTSAYIILHILLCKSKTTDPEMFAPAWKICFVISAHTSDEHLGMWTEDRWLKAPAKKLLQCQQLSTKRVGYILFDAIITEHILEKRGCNCPLCPPGYAPGHRLPLFLGYSPILAWTPGTIWPTVTSTLIVQSIKSILIFG